LQQITAGNDAVSGHVSMKMPTSPDGEERAFFLAFSAMLPERSGSRTSTEMPGLSTGKKRAFCFYTYHGEQVNTIVPLQPLKFKKGVFACHRI
jgi:hypothetical protein